MTQMFNPPHPGKVLREYLGDIDVTTAAKRLHVSRTTLSRILNGAPVGRARNPLQLLVRSASGLRYVASIPQKAPQD
jgi:hypothetical protein